VFLVTAGMAMVKPQKALLESMKENGKTENGMDREPYIILTVANM